MSTYSSFREQNGDSPVVPESASKRLETAGRPGAEYDSTEDSSSEERSPTRRRSAQVSNTKGDFTEPCVPAQFKLPRDLVSSLKLHSIAQGKSMSDIVLDCLTSPEMIAKAWISSRKAG